MNKKIVKKYGLIIETPNNKVEVKLARQGRKIIINVPENIKSSILNKQTIDMDIKVALGKSAELYWQTIICLKKTISLKLEFFLNQEAKLFNQVAAINGKMTGKINVELRGKHSQAETRVLGLAYKKQKIKMKINHRLMGLNCQSLIWTKCALQNGGFVELPMLSEIGKNARGAGVQEISKVLLLGDNIELTASPQLNIQTNGVLASHKFSANNIDANQLLYLQGRGINKDRAANIITRGFLADNSGNQNYQKYVKQEIEKTLI